MAHPLYIAFVWHQHQPDYRDPFGGPARLPWARLHAAKDYVHMAELVADFPAIHCTFNFVPSLVEQLAAIGAGQYTDRWQQLSLQHSWTPSEKRFLLDHFFSVHPRFLDRYPAYARLRDRRDEPNLPDAYFVDLAAWFNLAWIDARAIARDDTLRALVDKGGGYAPADVAAIVAKHCELAARVIPLHRELAARGQIELSVSPYYHPVLPLLIDQRSAHEALPGLPLPALGFAHPEDAAEQIRRALGAHRAHFGEPEGLWPPEGSVSEALLSVTRETFRWIASDEYILARSRGVTIGRDADGNVTNPRVLYQPYDAPRPGSPGARRAPRGVALVFRDHLLSDRIGFAYQYLSAHDAVQDLLWRLRVIRERIADSERGYLVSIILDGENAWESYEDNGDPFFRELYAAISSDASLRTVTVSEYLRENPPRESIPRLAAGSWINGNFDTWIGEPAQNRAWQLLAQTREALATWLRNYDLADPSVIARAWDELYIAEGSDWFWWYSSHNHSAQSAMFDELLRGHLQNVYATIGLPVPHELRQPILSSTERYRPRGITGVVAPRLAAEPSAGSEWDGAGVIEPAGSAGTMQPASANLSRIFYGYGADELFFRIESRVDLAPFRVAVYLSAPHAEHHNSRPRGAETDLRLALAWEIAVEPGQRAAQVYRAEGQEIWRQAPIPARVAVQDRVLELAVPRPPLRIELDDRLGLIVALAEDSQPIEVLPPQGQQFFELRNLS